ncbi:MAG: Class I peptide chain release factor [Candidatus Magasanikbacteria bacterium GW2011_GWA2_37_8]|uniref:Class I peptide chain release factor n=1 Tax=Candidatus Magasanikbacteria bacterium GW2011_GWA2_37_8 TaxID=1619036 RepID=A0A0G0JSI8_9BACT|nr:MAG: Class I peptide chain release factor [Candidatus Magasanikbacteria bacterium GW2011_GWA2_37_8]
MPQSAACLFQIPANEIRVSFARSSGAGGQNVNKTSTKVTVHWPIGRSQALSLEEKMRVWAKLANKINNKDELVAVSEEERSQSQNRILAILRLKALVASALRVPKKRQPTRPTRASKLKRIESKKIRSRVKIGRRIVE